MNSRHATDADLDYVCDLLASEFYDDPVLKFAFAESAQDARHAALERFFRVYVNLASVHGGILIAENGAGVLVYFRPEVMALTDNQRQQVEYQLQQQCAADYPAVAALMNGLDDDHPPAPPHYYVFAIAVQRLHRRKGVATTMLSDLQTVLNGKPCYAECTALSTQALFRHSGYGARATPIQIAGYPELYPVWREAQ